MGEGELKTGHSSEWERGQSRRVTAETDETERNHDGIGGRNDDGSVTGRVTRTETERDDEGRLAPDVTTSREYGTDIGRDGKKRTGRYWTGEGSDDGTDWNVETAKKRGEEAGRVYRTRHADRHSRKA